MKVYLDDVSTIEYDGMNNKSFISVKIGSFSDEFIEFIEKNIIRIYDGRKSYFDTKTIFNNLYDFFAKKNKSNMLYGAIAELLLVIIFTKNGFSQEYCYQDLEGSGIKKGFDGLFTKSSEVWLMESKSAYKGDSIDMNHSKIINIAYGDMKLRIKGGKTNNPWQNALNHAKAANSNDGLIKNLTELSTKYSKGIFGKVEEENIILGSTVYNDKIHAIDNSKELIEKATFEHTPKKQITVAINISNVEVVLDLIKDLKNE